MLQEQQLLLEQQQQQQPQDGYLAELQVELSKFCGLLSVVFVLQPLPLVQAGSINHRTQVQQEPGTQHWVVS